MSDDGANIEKLLERYVTGDLTDNDRELVEQYLTGSGADAARAREDLRFENLLVDSLEVKLKDDGVADAVLDRVFTRPLPESRKNFKPTLASLALSEAKESGRIGAPRRRFWTSRVRRYSTVAAACVVFVAAMYVNTSMNTGQSDWPVQPQPFIDTVAEVAYLEDKGVLVEDKEPVIPTIPASQKRRVVLPGGEIKTDDGESALVSMNDGGRVLVKPMSRVQIVRDKHGRKVMLKVLEGAMVYDFTGSNGAVSVVSSEGHSGRLKGIGQLELASRSAGATRPSVVNSLGQIMLVRVAQNGYAVFQSASGSVQIKSGQLGVVSPETVLTVDAKSRNRKNVLNPKDWSLEGIIREPAKPAVQVAQRLLKREDVVQEALRVYEFELIDMIAASFAIDVELARLGVEPTQGEIADARRYVQQDELMQVLPLRSADAHRVRMDQIAGMLAIDRHQRLMRKSKRKYEPPPVVRQRVWAQLHKNLIVDRKVKDKTVAFRVQYRGKSREVAKSETWGRLRQFLRRSELARLVKGLAEKTILDIWLENLNLDWPSTPDAANFPHVAVAQMAGLTRVQMQDLYQIESLILQNSRTPTNAELERFMKEKVAKRRRLVFDHYFFPTTDPFRGTPYDKKRQTIAFNRARNVTNKLRKGEALVAGDIQASTPRYTGSLWKSGTAGGPKPWWMQIYGRNFMLNAMNLSKGEVSDPIASPEGFHVVALRHEGEDKTDPRTHKSYAQLIYRFELARLEFERQVRGKTNLLLPLEDMLK